LYLTEGREEMNYFRGDNMSDDYSAEELQEMNRRLSILLREKGINRDTDGYSDYLEHYAEQIKHDYDDETSKEES
jgi:hypothetical protein